MANDMMVKELDQVVVRFSGDSGDGMQLAGNIFSTVSATVGNDSSSWYGIAVLPFRAPATSTMRVCSRAPYNYPVNPD